MDTQNGNSTQRWQQGTVVFGYTLVLAAMLLAWSVRNQNVIRADDGAGYAMGIIGASLMILLLAYPLRKRVRALQSLGSIRFWFKTHMIFGIVGPLLVLLHSNFKLGSTNSRVALFATLVVAASGIVGRYLYAKIHNGMYGHRATLQNMMSERATPAATSAGLASVIALIDNRLGPLEMEVRDASSRFLPSLLIALRTPFVLRKLAGDLTLEMAQTVQALAVDSPVIDAHRDRLLASARAYLTRRLRTFAKFSQLSACERLFSFWHVVHFPLFVVMAVAAVIHVIAVHVY